MWPSVLQLEIYSSCFCLTEAALHTPQASFLHGCAMNSKPLTQLLVAPSGGGGAAMKSFGCMILFHVPLQWYKISSEIASLTLCSFLFTIFDREIRKCAVLGIGCCCCKQKYNFCQTRCISLGFVCSFRLDFNSCCLTVQEIDPFFSQVQLFRTNTFNLSCWFHEGPGKSKLWSNWYTY